MHTDMTEDQLGKWDQATQIPTGRRSYKLNVTRRQKESFLLIDGWDQGLEKAIGHHGERLKRLCTAEVVRLR